MSYKALYRTYRPSTFDEVYGQKHIVKTLSNAIKENKIAHAYLFCGPRGTGKTSMARLFAKALNCQEGFGHQCNHCANCLAIGEGTHPDVIEIDAASNRGIDDIRDLINKVKYAPIRGKYKVYIIDEVHMMTSEAFNALLKTLEEPPANVVFILATTEPFKLMPTILSRVQRYDFSKVGDSEILANLKRVLNQEKISYEENALKLIVSLSDGGVRDSLSLLDQAIAYCGDTIRTDDVQDLFSLSSLEDRIELVRFIEAGDILNGSEKLNSLIGRGVDVRRLTADLIEIAKDLLIYRTTKDASILKVIDVETARSLPIARDHLDRMLDVLIETSAQFRFAGNPQSLFEVSLIKLASYCASSSEKTEAKKEEKPNEAEEEKTVSIPKPEKKKEEKPIDPHVKKQTFPIAPLKEEGESYFLNEEDTINLMMQGNKVEKNDVLEKWKKIDDWLDDAEIGKYANALKKCAPRIISRNILVLETNFVSVANLIRIKENQKGFSQLVEKITGKNYLVLVLTMQESIERVQKFSNLRQANKLPEIYPVDIHY